MEITREELEEWQRRLDERSMWEIGLHGCETKDFMLRMIDQLLRLQDWKDIYANRNSA